MTAPAHFITEHLDIWSAALSAKSASGRGKNNKLELYGLKKLRELILELAVRGLLVPQDPNDEPASVLLEKIAAEKARLIKEGKIKKQKKLPPISENEKPHELPMGWEWARLSSALKKITDGTHRSPPNGEKGDFLYISAKNIKPEGVLLSNATYVTKEVHEEIYSRCDPEEGDILYIKDGATTGIVTINNLAEPFSMLSSVALLKSTKDIFNKYLLIALTAPYFYKEMRAGMTGVAITRVTLKKLDNALIALPPLAEQQRIVAKVDELMALCDRLEQEQEQSLSAHQTLVHTLLAVLSTAAEQERFDEAWARIAAHFDILFTSEESIEQLKQTILQLAVMGKLVPQDPNDEPASALLEKIAAEKARLIKEGRIKKQKKLSPIAEDEKPFDLPEGWEWVRLGDAILEIEAGKSPSCLAHPAGLEEWGVIKISAISWGEFLPEENKCLGPAVEPFIEKEIKPNDFIITRANTAELVAKSVVVGNTRNRLLLNDKTLRINFSQHVFLQHMNLVNNSPSSREYYARVATGSSPSMKNITRDSIKCLIIPLPPTNEQHRVVAKVDELMDLCDSLKERITAARSTQRHLADAMAEQALGRD